MSSRRPREIHRQQGLLTPLWLRYAPLLIVGAHFLLALAYNAATPFGNNGYANTPDEGAHFQYVAYVARAWRLPLFEGYEGVGYEAHQPPLYYFLAGIAYHLAGGAGKGVRLLSTLCSAGVVWLTWLTARRLFPQNTPLALSAMGFVAFLPMHLAIGATVNNDALTNLLFAGVLYAFAPPPPPSAWRDGVRFGMLLGLALLTKATALILVPAIAVGLALRYGKVWRASLSALALAFAIAGVLSGWWFVRNALLYEDPLLQKTFVRVFAGTAKAEDFYAQGMSVGDYARLIADWTFRSFWFAYGTPQTARTGLPNFLPDSVYWGLLTWCALALGGLGVRAGQSLKNRSSAEPTQRAWWIVAAVLTGLVLASFVLFVRVFFQTQGRYFYPALAPIAITLTLGWESLFPAERRALAHGALSALWLLLALGCWRYL